MPKLASRVETIKPSMILSIAQKARELKESGKDVISFSVGVPNFLPAQHVYDAVAESIHNDKGVYLSSRGEGELIDAYINKLTRDGIEGFKQNHVACGIGAKHLLFSLMMSMLEKGDEVILIAPTWGSYIDDAEFFGAKPVIIECSAKDNYKLDPERLEYYVTDKTKMIIFNNPTNPTGMVYESAEIKALAEKLEQYKDMWVISDDIYDNMIYDGLKFDHLWHYASDELKQRMVLVNSISKTYGMPGWRVGYLACLNETVSKTITALNANSITNVPAPAVAAATAALNGSHEFVKQQCLEFEKKRDIVMQYMAKDEKIKCPLPQGAFYAFPDISACFGKSYNGRIITSAMDFCKILLEEKLLACVPGEVFADNNGIRISYACSEKDLVEGLTRFIDFVNNIK